MATLKGIWKLNDELIMPDNFIMEEVNFVSNGIACTQLDFIMGGDLYYRDSGVGCLYSNDDGGWLYEDFKIIDFTEEQEVSADFYAWLTANAVRQDTPTATITYNGTETTIETGQTATLACNGKKALTDVVVAFGADGSIAYNGTETAVSAGQTATMVCAGKKMLTDVVVAV